MCSIVWWVKLIYWIKIRKYVQKIDKIFDKWFLSSSCGPKSWGFTFLGRHRGCGLERKREKSAYWPIQGQAPTWNWHVYEVVDTLPSFAHWDPWRMASREPCGKRWFAYKCPFICHVIHAREPRFVSYFI